MRQALRSRTQATGGAQHPGLRYVALLYGFGLFAHTADHLRRGIDVLTPEVFWAGILSTTVGLTAILLIFSKHRLAPYFALLAGFPIAFGVAAVHLLPDWGVLSDAFPGAHGTGVTALSWGVVLIEIAGALAMGTAGLIAVAAERGRPGPLVLTPGRHSPGG